MGMKITILSEQDALQKIKKMAVSRKYSEVYCTIENLEKGKCAVFEFDTEKEAKNVSDALFNARYRGREIMVNCYITKSRNIVIVGKN